MQRPELLVGRLRLAVPSAHPLGRRARIRLAEVSSEPFVMLRPTSLPRQLCEDLCAGAGFRPTSGFEGDDLPTVRGFVAAGLGASIVPALREGSPDAVGGPLRYLEIADNLTVRGMGSACPGRQGVDCYPSPSCFVSTLSPGRPPNCSLPSREAVDAKALYRAVAQGRVA